MVVALPLALLQLSHGVGAAALQLQVVRQLVLQRACAASQYKDGKGKGVRGGYYEAGGRCTALNCFMAKPWHSAPQYSSGMRPCSPHGKLGICWASR